jgi:hypothetical protein
VTLALLLFSRAVVARHVPATLYSSYGQFFGRHFFSTSLMALTLGAVVAGVMGCLLALCCWLQNLLECDTRRQTLATLHKYDFLPEPFSEDDNDTSSSSGANVDDHDAAQRDLELGEGTAVGDGERDDDASQQKEQRQSLLNNADERSSLLASEEDEGPVGKGSGVPTGVLIDVGIDTVEEVATVEEVDAVAVAAGRQTSALPPPAAKDGAGRWSSSSALVPGRGDEEEEDEDEDEASTDDEAVAPFGNLPKPLENEIVSVRCARLCGVSACLRVRVFACFVGVCGVLLGACNKQGVAAV